MKINCQLCQNEFDIEDMVEVPLDILKEVFRGVVVLETDESLVYLCNPCKEIMVNNEDNSIRDKSD